MVATPGLIQWILIGIVVEAIVVSALLARARLGRWIAPYLFFLFSGGVLMAAIAFALRDPTSLLVAPLLGLSGLAHIATLVLVYRRLRTPGG
ncbi:MAG: hypothetical protein AAFR11_07860 [Pseudomonadota bacterium]